MKEVLLIGNGPSCLDKELGELIDSHETVIRFNDFETKGYEKHVGTKTDVWVKTKMSSKHITKNFKSKFYVYPNIIRCTEEEKKILVNDGFNVIPVKFYNKVNKLLDAGNLWATTGLVMIYYFIEKGYNVKIHGFDFFENGVHYYKDDNKMIGHRPDLEKALVNNLINKGEVKLLYNG